MCDARKSLLTDARSNVRYMALLGLLETKDASATEVLPLRADPDPEVRDMMLDTKAFLRGDEEYVE